MSECYSSAYICPGAELGKVNPLPDIKNISYIHAGIEMTQAVPEDCRQYINQGMISTLLPYQQQDGYNRSRQHKVFHSVVLENGFLKAVFLPELGGRLWSLYDKTARRELLYCNPVFQPANLALRNAWFSGGVEFNISVKGHNPLTCEPLFAQKIRLPDGSEGLRMYEYERIRGVLYSIDAWIPEKSRFLYIRPKIENRTGRDIWMYWWSNIAVPCHRHTRVLVPAQNTFINYFGNDHYVLDYAGHPDALGTDISYPENIPRSLDFFYHIPDEAQKWIAAVDESGYGLLQCSTPELKGRKLFVWGQGEGGKNWNRYLSDGSNSGYIEIQAGMARTQLEHIPMPSGATWSFLESYGAFDCGVEAHGEWPAAQAAAERQITDSFGSLSDTLNKAKQQKATAGEMLSFGSGWGVLEEYRRKELGLPGLSDEIRLPRGALGETQKQWLVLLYEGYLPERNADEEPMGYVTEAFWRQRLENSVKQPQNRNWYALMHLGVMEYAAGNPEKALEYFMESGSVLPNAWSFRNIAMIYRNELNDFEKAYEYMQKAFGLNKTCRGILVDTAVTCLAARKNREWLADYEQIGSFQSDGRLKFYCAEALMALGDYEEAAEYLNQELVMPDIKEGDTAISDTWFRLYGKLISDRTGITDSAQLHQLVEEQYPLGQLDFRTC